MRTYWFDSRAFIKHSWPIQLFLFLIDILKLFESSESILFFIYFNLFMVFKYGIAQLLFSLSNTLIEDCKILRKLVEIVKTCLMPSLKDLIVKRKYQGELWKHGCRLIKSNHYENKNVHFSHPCTLLISSLLCLFIVFECLYNCRNYLHMLPLDIWALLAIELDLY